MDIDVVSLLRELDFSIETGMSTRSWSLRSPQTATFMVTIVPSVERISARTTRNFIVHQGSPVRPLFVGCTATDSVLEQARSGLVDVLTEQPLQLILKGTVFAPEFDHQDPAPRKSYSGNDAMHLHTRYHRGLDTPIGRWQQALCFVTQNLVKGDNVMTRTHRQRNLSLKSSMVPPHGCSPSTR